MFGYACDETPELMPMTIHYSHRLLEHLTVVRKNGQLGWLRPDSKRQVADAELIVADEPGRGRDPATQLALLLALQQASRTAAVLFFTADFRLALNMGRRSAGRARPGHARGRHRKRLVRLQQPEHTACYVGAAQAQRRGAADAGNC